MKIAYLTFERPGESSGVGKKIKFQILEWRRAGHEVQHLVLNTADQSVEADTQYLFQNSRTKPMLDATLHRHILRNAIIAHNPDLIYLRQMLWWPGLLQCLKGFTVIQEINSDLSHEYELRYGMASPKLHLYRFSKAFLNQSTHGFVFVSRELATRYRVNGVPYCVIGNGYQFTRDFEANQKQNNRPQLVFVSSPDQPWQGNDKVLEMAALLPELDFHIVVPGVEPSSLDNVYCYGELTGQALLSLYRKMDIGIGTIALHRKKMEEASALKTREYAANGLPIIAGYDDTDLSGTPYFLNIGNHENNVCSSIELIRSFVRQWMTQAFPIDDARARLSYEHKERRRLRFFEETLNGTLQTSLANHQ